MEDKIENAKQPLFDGTDTEILYYSDFGDTKDAEDKVLPYGKRSKTRTRLKLTRLTSQSWFLI